MDLSRRCILHLVAAAASLTVRARIAQADNFPSRPITWVVPFPAGGPMDTLSRVLTERLRQVIGQPIIIENVSGAAGSIGVGRVARASPDGYTLIHGIWSTHVVNAIVYKLPYHVLNDFTPIALLTDNSMLIVGRKTLPAKNLQELIDWLKTKPEGALAGTAGVGSPQHVFAVFFEEQTGTHLRFVHYHGGAPAMQDLLAGRIDLMIADQTTALPQIRNGNIKVFAVTSKTPLAEQPDIPTVIQSGLPTFLASVWGGVWAPKGTAANVIAKLDSAIIETLDDSALRDRLQQLGQTVVPREQQTPQALAKLQKAEIKKWWPIIKAAGIKAE
jgi:tripartite-type tricarboxylate transporter receptor subunit TctC